MVIDTSALLAILFDQVGAALFAEAIERDPLRLISAASLIEASLVVTVRYGEAGERELDLLIHRANIQVEPVTQEHIEWARHGWSAYGLARHRGGLNFGDCFAYALAKASGEPLLFKGEAFRQTDVTAVELYPTV